LGPLSFAFSSFLVSVAAVIVGAKMTTRDRAEPTGHRGRVRRRRGLAGRSRPFPHHLRLPSPRGAGWSDYGRRFRL